jgi:hypothetical protein
MDFRKRPIVISAEKATERTTIATLEGVLVADAGDWIITGIKGEKYPCKPDIFEATYERVDDARAREALDTPEGVLSALEGIAKRHGYCEIPVGNWGVQECRIFRVANRVVNRNERLWYESVSYSVAANATVEDLSRDEALALIGKWMGATHAER